MSVVYVPKNPPPPPPPERKPHYLQKLTAWATLIATIIAALALVVSIYVITMTSRQNTEQAKQQKQQALTQLQLQQHQQLSDSLQAWRLLLREDSLSKLHDSMSSEQLRLLRMQSDIIAGQQLYQRLAVQNEVVYKSPRLDCYIKNLTPDTSTDTQILNLEMLNNGLVDALDVNIELFLYHPLSKRCLYSTISWGAVSPSDTVGLNVGFTAKSYNIPFTRLPIYLIVKFDYKHPMAQGRQTSRLGWKYERLSSQKANSKASLGPTEIAEIQQEILENYSSDLAVKIIPEKALDSLSRNFTATIINASKNNLKDLNIDLTVFGEDDEIGINKFGIEVKNISPGGSHPVVIKLPEEIYQSFKGSENFGALLKYTYKPSFNQDLQHRKAIFLCLKTGSHNMKDFLGWSPMLSLEQELDGYKVSSVK